jgi:hypothetical protein
MGFEHASRLIGTYALSAGYYDAYYLKAQKTRHLISNDFKEAFKKVDVIMGPVSPTTAFDLGSFKDPVSMYLADIYTLSTNLAGLPVYKKVFLTIDKYHLNLHRFDIQSEKMECYILLPLFSLFFG